MFLINKLLGAVLVPPTVLWLCCALGIYLLCLRTVWLRRLGLALAITALGSQFMLSLPWFGNRLLQSLEHSSVINTDALRQAEAIVVLGGGNYHAAPEYGGDTVGKASLERVRYAAHLYRLVARPILVTGGAPFGGTPEGEVMHTVLTEEFAVPVRWVESQSRNTAENALFSARQLKAAGISRIALISHAWHLPRAIPLFEAQGLTVIPAPMGFTTAAPDPSSEFIPGSFEKSHRALTEYLGMAYDALRATLAPAQPAQ